MPALVSGGQQRPAGVPVDDGRPGVLQPGAARGLPLRQRHRRSEAPPTSADIVQELSDFYPEGRRGRAGRRDQEPRLPLRDPVGRHLLDRRRAHPAGEGAASLDRYEKEADKVEQQFKRGIITDGERRQKEVEIWTNATSEVEAAMSKVMGADTFNPIEMMVTSGARRATRSRSARSPACEASSPTPEATSSRGRSRATSVRAWRCSSTSSPRRAPGRASSTPPCGRPTPAT